MGGYREDGVGTCYCDSGCSITSCTPQQSITLDSVSGTQLVGFYIKPSTLDTFTLFEPFFSAGLDTITDRFGNVMDATGSITPGAHSLSGGNELTTIKTYEGYRLDYSSGLGQKQDYPGSYLQATESYTGDATFTVLKTRNNYFSPPANLPSYDPELLFADLLADKSMRVFNDEGKRFYYSGISNNWESEFGDVVVGEAYLIRPGVDGSFTVD
jgi:hypothetical protein